MIQNKTLVIQVVFYVFSPLHQVSWGAVLDKEKKNLLNITQTIQNWKLPTSSQKHQDQHTQKNQAEK